MGAWADWRKARAEVAAERARSKAYIREEKAYSAEKVSTAEIESWENIEKAKIAAAEKTAIAKATGKDAQWLAYYEGKGPKPLNAFERGWAKVEHGLKAPQRAMGKALKWGALGVGAAVVASWLFGGKKSADPAADGSVEAAQASLAPSAGDLQVAAQAAIPEPEPIGVGPNGKPYYGPVSAAATGVKESKTLPPRMSAAAYENLDPNGRINTAEAQAGLAAS